MTSFLSNLSIRIKILVIPLVATFGFTIYFFTIASTNYKVVAILETAQNNDYKILKISNELIYYQDKMKNIFANAASDGDVETLEDSRSEAQEVRNRIGQLNALGVDPVISKLLSNSFDNYFEFSYELSRDLAEGTADFSQISDRSTEMTRRLKELTQHVNEFQTTGMSLVDKRLKEIDLLLSKAFRLGTAIAVITLIFLLFVTIAISLSVRRNIGQIINSMKNISNDNGDLTVRLTAANEDEFGELIFWFNSFMEKLQDVVRNVIETGSPLAKTSEEISNLSEISLKLFDTQNMSVMGSEESVESLNDSVKEVFQNATEATTAAIEARNDAQKGRELVSSADTSIYNLAESLEESSKTITALKENTDEVNVVLEVIRSIAEKTNLLALNAAIEAARAGEQGRGFAVVADEVRNLAGVTQESVKEITTMLDKLELVAESAVKKMGTSREQLEISVTQTKQVGVNLVQISNSVEKIVKTNSSIASATAAQLTFSENMVKHMGDIRTSVKNASKANSDIAEASIGLKCHSKKLEEISAKFVV